jgi:hypothetical protein
MTSTNQYNTTSFAACLEETWRKQQAGIQISTASITAAIATAASFELLLACLGSTSSEAPEAAASLLCMLSLLQE